MDKVSRHRWITTTVAVVFSSLSACTPQSPSGNQASLQPTATPQASPASENVPKVIATNTVLCDLTKQIAATTVNLTCLVKPGADPHVYQATPEDRKAIEQANLVLYGGYNFEPTLIKLIQSQPQKLQSMNLLFRIRSSLKKMEKRKPIRMYGTMPKMGCELRK
jgi:manganese/iron transport system substrate-binding protein